MFDGSNDAVAIPNDPSLNPTDAITISAWFNAASQPDTYANIVAKSESSAYYLEIDTYGSDCDGPAGSVCAAVRIDGDYRRAWTAIGNQLRCLASCGFQL